MEREPLNHWEAIHRLNTVAVVRLRCKERMKSQGWEPGIMGVWNCGSLELWEPGTVGAWNCGSLELWELGIVGACLL